MHSLLYDSVNAKKIRSLHSFSSLRRLRVLMSLQIVLIYSFVIVFSAFSGAGVCLWWCFNGEGDWLMQCAREGRTTEGEFLLTRFKTIVQLTAFP